MLSASPKESGIPPIRVLGSGVVPLTFHPKDKVRNIRVRGVEGLPYGLILGASYFARNRSVRSFAGEVGFCPLPKAPRVPFDNSIPRAQPRGVTERWRAQPGRTRQKRKRVYKKRMCVKKGKLPRGNILALSSPLATKWTPPRLWRRKKSG